MIIPFNSLLGKFRQVGYNSIFTDSLYVYSVSNWLLKFNHSSCNMENKETSEMTSNTTFQIDKTAYTIVKEGSAEVLFPNSHDVFYNPVQEFNRDISIAVLNEYSKQVKQQKQEKKAKEVEKNSCNNGIRIVECLAASGLRSIRYAKEVNGVEKIISNDIADEAVESIRRNIEYNKVEDLVEISHNDAGLLLYTNRSFSKQFDVVDLDPYGSPVAFLDPAVQSVKDGGLLMVTCTDLAVLCGNHSETCRAKYGSASIRNKCCHEMALRIVLQSIESHANRYGRYIIPLLSISVDFYIRMFMIVKTSQKMVKCSSSKLSLVYQCSGCDTMSLQSLGKTVKKGENFKHSLATGPPVNTSCEFCGSKHHLAGPIWSREIHDKAFVQKLLSSVEENPDSLGTSRRIIGMLNVINDESEDSPLYYQIDRLSQILNVQPPNRKDFWSAILNAGYQTSASHAAKSSLKTNAPPSLIWDIMKTWRNKLNESEKLKELDPNSISHQIMSKPILHEISFEPHDGLKRKSMQKGLLRYQVNPEPNWGPKARAKSSLKYDSIEEKRKRLQGKRKNLKEVKSNDT